MSGAIMPLWLMEYWKPAGSDRSPVKKELLAMLLSSKPAQGQIRKLVRGAEDFGPHGFRMPNNKNLGDGLFELRDTVNHFRYYYCETDFCYLIDAGSRRIVLLMLVAGDDKDKQQQDIKEARKRMNAITRDNLLNDSGLDIVPFERKE